MSPRKSHPKGIDPANPQKNFVKAYYENRGMDPYAHIYDYALPDSHETKKASGFGHSVDKRVGKLRVSGMVGAHRIGARKK